MGLEVYTLCRRPLEDIHDIVFIKINFRALEGTCANAPQVSSAF